MSCYSSETLPRHVITLSHGPFRGVTWRSKIPQVTWDFFSHLEPNGTAWMEWGVFLASTSPPSYKDSVQILCVFVFGNVLSPLLLPWSPHRSPKDILTCGPNFTREMLFLGVICQGFFTRKPIALVYLSGVGTYFLKVHLVRWMGPS